MSDGSHEEQQASDGDAWASATGRELRDRREARGGDLVEIAETLCIRREFLDAIERGDHGALPGTAYAVGFVRTYARHLGLDGDRLAQQFKIEVSGAVPTAKLDFLSPVPESRIPRAALVLVAVCLAVVVYGLWYYMNARDLSFKDIIPDVPAQLGGAPVPKEAPPSPTSQDTQQAAVPASEPVPPAPSGADSIPASPAHEDVTAARASAMADEAEKIAETVPPATAPAAVPAPPPVVAQSISSSVPRSTPPAAASAVEPATGGAAPPATAAAPPPAAVEPTVPTAEREEPSVAAVSPADGAVSEPPAPSNPSSVAGRPRIELVATSDSWVQVRASDGKLLMTRILRAGTRRTLPAQEGLRLTTGNAGGLTVVIDGEAMPPLGKFGAVRRGILLDREGLKAGVAAR